ncbi:MAG: hypothetical protein EBZ55_02315, partial [Actinobacteria bacterium]|nr:hypothetical protein [Actinomycetota bacterium]
MSNWYDEPAQTTPVPTSAPTPEHSSPMPPPPPPTKRRRPGIVLVALIIGFAGGIAGAVVADELNIGSSTTSSNSPVQLSEVDSDDPSIGDTVIAQVANVLADSV